MPFYGPTGGGATRELDNLRNVSINVSLISDTDSTDDLGSSSIFWANAFTDKVHFNATADINGSSAGVLLTTGSIIPSVDDTDNLGATTFAYATIFARNIDDRDGVGGITFLADINLGGNRNIDNANAVYITERADADLDIAGNGQLWVNTATPNEMFFTDDAGTDFRLGLREYEAVVDAAGGADYTTIEGAFDDGKTVVFVRNGTYNPASDIDIPTGGKLTGESRAGVIIDFQSEAGRNITAATGNDDITLENFTLFDCQGGSSTGSIHFVNTDNSVVRNVWFAGGNDISVKFAAGNNNIITGCLFNVVQGNNDISFVDMGSNFSAVVGNVFENCQRTGINTRGQSNIISGNAMEGTGSTNAIEVLTSGIYTAIVGNTMRNWRTGVKISESDVLVSGNFIAGAGVDAAVSIGTAGEKSVVTGNFFFDQADGIFLSTVEDCMIFGNYGRSLTNRLINLSTNATNTYVFGNYGKSEGERAIDEARFMWMKNTSGGQLVLGDLITYKAVAAGDEITTTTTQGDNLVYGMVAETTNDNAYGRIQIIGKTKKLKVDGTTDIAVGDFIGTFTTAKIGQKAAVGDTAIAIALEAYTTDDSNGVIDALLINPRLI